MYDKDVLNNIEAYDVNINNLDHDVTHDSKLVPKVSKFKKIIKGTISWIITIIVAMLIAFIVNIIIIRPSEVSGTSMVPTLSDEEKVFISKLPYIFSEPKFGDILVIDKNVNRPRTFLIEIEDSFKYNILTKKLYKSQSNDFWIKRVIGVAGDVIEYKDGKIFRNDIELVENYINSTPNKRYPNNTKVLVQKNFIYVMGDNRGDSKDSRSSELGQVPLTNVVGKLVFHK